MSTDSIESAVEALKMRGGLEAFQASLIEWFRAEGRDYPWRRTKDPYAILVSEAMLQQTQIATVLGRGYYERWMEQFPDWGTLAQASESEVLKSWEGLGYYNRARNLQRAAQAVHASDRGCFPEDMKEARALPGVGAYTAGAVLSFAYGQSVPIVDGNVARVYARMFCLDQAINSSVGEKILWRWAAELVPQQDPDLFNAALMELGQRYCRPRNPECQLCPVQTYCRAYERGELASYPVKQKRSPITEKEERVFLFVRKGAVYLTQETGRRRRGLWRLPETDHESTADLSECVSFHYPITRYRVCLRAYEAPLTQPLPDFEGEAAWFQLERDKQWPPLGAPYRKALLLYRDLCEIGIPWE